jgi:hypothetical protein
VQCKWIFILTTQSEVPGSESEPAFLAQVGYALAQLWSQAFVMLKHNLHPFEQSSDDTNSDNIAKDRGENEAEKRHNHLQYKQLRKRGAGGS